MQEAENQEDIAKAFEEVSEDLGYKVKVIYTDPSNSSQLIGIDKEIKNIFKSTDEEYITKEEKRNAEKILEKEYGKKYEVDWEQYDDINGFNYRRKINYLVYQAENRINDLSEIENGNFETAPEKESVLHNFIKTKDGIKIVISDSLRNIKKVDYETGKEVVISANG